MGFFKVCCVVFSGSFQNLCSASTAQQLALLTTVTDALNSVGDISDRSSDTPQGLEYAIQCQLHVNKPYPICRCVINIDSSVCVGLFCNVTRIVYSQSRERNYARLSREELLWQSSYCVVFRPALEIVSVFPGLCSNGDEGDHVEPTIYRGVQQKPFSQFAFYIVPNYFPLYIYYVLCLPKKGVLKCFVLTIDMGFLRGQFYPSFLRF